MDVTITPNGTDKIGGTNANATLINKGQFSVTFVYVDSTQGWLNTEWIQHLMLELQLL